MNVFPHPAICQLRAHEHGAGIGHSAHLSSVHLLHGPSIGVATLTWRIACLRGIASLGRVSTLRRVSALRRVTVMHGVILWRVLLVRWRLLV